jgi:hypothetical protein
MSSGVGPVLSARNLIVRQIGSAAPQRGTEETAAPSVVVVIEQRLTACRCGVWVWIRGYVFFTAVVYTRSAALLERAPPHHAHLHPIGVI